jgi:multiple sugar transport system permease protein
VTRPHRTTALLLALVAIASLAAAAPFLWMILTSIKSPPDLFASTLQILPRNGVVWDAYARIWSAGGFARYFLNSLWVSTAATGLSVALSILAALAFARYPFAGRNALLLLILVTQLFPLVLLVPPTYAIMRDLRILDTHLSLIVAYVSFALPFSIWMLTGYFRSIPEELEEAARIDGATRFGAHARVTLPLAGPGIAATVIYCFILAWNEVLFATTFISTAALRTLPIGLQAFIGQYQTDWNLLMAGAVLTTIPVVVLFVFLQRYLVAGLTAGAVKG